MTWSLVQQTTAQVQGLVGTLPANPTPGNLLIAWVGTGDGTAIGAPAGWTQVQNILNGTKSQVTIFAYFNNPGSSLGTSYTFTGGASARVAVAEFTCPGVAAVLGASDTGTNTAGAVTSLTVTSAGTAKAGDLGIGNFYQRITAAAITWTDPTGYSETNSLAVASASVHAWSGYDLSLAAGGTQTVTLTSTATGASSGWAGAIATFSQPAAKAAAMTTAARPGRLFRKPARVFTLGARPAVTPAAAVHVAPRPVLRAARRPSFQLVFKPAAAAVITPVMAPSVRAAAAPVSLQSSRRRLARGQFQRGIVIPPAAAPIVAGFVTAARPRLPATRPRAVARFTPVVLPAAPPPVSARTAPRPRPRPAAYQPVIRVQPWRGSLVTAQRAPPRPRRAAAFRPVIVPPAAPAAPIVPAAVTAARAGRPGRKPQLGFRPVQVPAAAAQPLIIVPRLVTAAAARTRPRRGQLAVPVVIPPAAAPPPVPARVAAARPARLPGRPRQAFATVAGRAVPVPAQIARRAPAPPRPRRPTYQPAAWVQPPRVTPVAATRAPGRPRRPTGAFSVPVVPPPAAPPPARAAQTAAAPRPVTRKARAQPAFRIPAVPTAPAGPTFVFSADPVTLWSSGVTARWLAGNPVTAWAASQPATTWQAGTQPAAKWVIRMPGTMSVSALSAEFVNVNVTAQLGGVTVNPTGFPVAMAFTTPGTAPTAGQWNAASWLSGTTGYWAQCLVGPGGVVLAAGKYDVWVRVTGSPEVPVKPAGSLTVF